MMVGDKYRVVENPYKYREVWPGFIGNMDQYCGKVVTIRSINFSHDGWLYVKLEEDSGRFWWSSEFLIPLKQRSE